MIQSTGALARSCRERNTSLSRVVQRFLTQWAGQDDPTAVMARLERLFSEADARDRKKPGSAGPFSRDDLYGERLDRFR